MSYGVLHEVVLDQRAEHGHLVQRQPEHVRDLLHWVDLEGHVPALRHLHTVKLDVDQLLAVIGRHGLGRRDKADEVGVRAHHAVDPAGLLQPTAVEIQAQLIRTIGAVLAARLAASTAGLRSWLVQQGCGCGWRAHPAGLDADRVGLEGGGGVVQLLHPVNGRVELLQVAHALLRAQRPPASVGSARRLAGAAAGGGGSRVRRGAP